MYEYIIDYSKKMGYHHYEISNFAKREKKHSIILNTGETKSM